MGLHARLNAKSARFIGAMTLLSAIFVTGSWGIIPGFFIGLAGVPLLTANTNSARGLQGVLRGFTWWALITIGIAVSPVVG